MEAKDKLDKNWWRAMDFLYWHLQTTGQSWSHMQKLTFAHKLSELLSGIERNAKIPIAPEPTQQPIDKDLLLKLVKAAFEKGKANPTVHASYLFGYADIDAMVGELLGMDLDTTTA